MVDFNYDPGVDILVIDLEDRKPEDYKESLPLGDYIVDLDEENNFLGLEILNASRNLPFSKEELESIQEIELNLQEKGGATTVAANITYSGNKGQFSLGYESAEA